MDLSTFTEDDLYAILLYEDKCTQEEIMFEALPIYFSGFLNSASPFVWRFSYNKINNLISYYLKAARDDSLGVCIDIIPLAIGIDISLVKDNLVVEYWYQDEKVKTSIFDKELLDEILNPKEEGEDDSEEEANRDDGSAGQW